MTGNDSLSFSTDALINRSDFYNGLNDINFYVEDIDSQYLYETILKRILGKQYKIRTIFPCGGKPAVIEAYHIRGKETDGIHNVYLVDGDFDRLIYPEKMIKSQCFVYLEMYNIESCLINELGLCQWVKGQLKCLDIDAKNALQYQSWRTRIIREAKNLFLCYCFLQKHDPQKQNVHTSHYRFLDQKTGFMKTDGSFERYQQELFRTHPDAEEEIFKLRELFEQQNGNHYEKLICGKFLMSSLHDYLYVITKSSIPKDDLLWILACTFDVNSLDYVKKACIFT